MIREFRPEDAEAIATTLIEPGEDGAVTGPGLAHLVAALPERADGRFWVCVHEGEIAGWARVQRKWSSDPSVVRLRALIRADRRARGFGTTLWAQAEVYARSLGPRLLQTPSDSGSVSTSFLVRRGFSPGRRIIISAVDLRTDGPPPPEPPPGVRLAPLAELRDRPEELFELYRRTEEDIPADVNYGRMTFEEWYAETVEHPDLDWESSVVAIEDGRPVSFTFLLVDRERARAENEMTGTLPECRGRGLARLVKIESMRRAADAGIAHVFTGNDEENEPMLAINRTLGYRQVKVLTTYELEV